MPAYDLGSGNVFEDLQVAHPEEALAKAKIARAICNLTESEGTTQTELAQRLGLDQPAVSRLLRGRLAEFSVGRLLLLLMRLGQVDLIVRVR